MYRPNEQDSGISFSRVLLAIAISIAFFAIYSYLFPQKSHNTPAQTMQNSANQAINQIDSASAAPQVSAQSLITTQTQPQDDKAVQSAPKSLKNTIISHIDSKEFELEIDALGRIKQVYLKDEKYTRNDQTSLFAMISEVLGFKKTPNIQRDKLPLFSNNPLQILEVRFSDNALNQKAFETPYTANISHINIVNEPVEIILTQNLDKVIITKTLRIYQDLHYEAKITLSNPNIEYFISNGMRPTADTDTYAFRGVITKNIIDDVLHKFEDGDASAEYIAKNANNIRTSSFVASVDRYYTSLFFTKEQQGFFVVLSGDTAQNPMPFVRFEGNAEFFGYIGPKIYHNLSAIDKGLGDVVEYGRITFFAKPLFLLLAYLHSWCGNWGWAIVVLTLLVRIVLYPLTYKGMVSMQKLKDIAPKMKDIQTKYKDDPQKLQMHMMDLYKKHGANPLGGCLPLLLQIPVFFAIYRVLHNAVELKSSAWIGWIDDLSAIDPYFVLPILMGLSMYISQKITPSNFSDPMQEKIFKMLPLIFAVFFIIFPFPAGLVLYWTTSNVFSIIQQISINKMLQRRKAKEIELNKHHEKEDKK